MADKSGGVAPQRITQELRRAMTVDKDFAGVGGKIVTYLFIEEEEFGDLCDAIDSIDGQLAAENARLRDELEALRPDTYERILHDVYVKGLKRVPIVLEEYEARIERLAGGAE